MAPVCSSGQPPREWVDTRGTRLGKIQEFRDEQMKEFGRSKDAEIQGIERCKRARMNRCRSLGPPEQKWNLESSLNCLNPSLRAATHHIKSNPHSLGVFQSQKAQIAG